MNIDTCTILQEAPNKLSSAQSVSNVMSILKRSKFCLGNPDAKFEDVVRVHQGSFKDMSGELTGTLA